MCHGKTYNPKQNMCDKTHANLRLILSFFRRSRNPQGENNSKFQESSQSHIANPTEDNDETGTKFSDIKFKCYPGLRSQEYIAYDFIITHLII